jgi:hypothetical protein
MKSPLRYIDVNGVIQTPITEIETCYGVDVIPEMDKTGKYQTGKITIKLSDEINCLLQAINDEVI